MDVATLPEKRRAGVKAGLARKQPSNPGTIDLSYSGLMGCAVRIRGSDFRSEQRQF